MHHPSFVRMPWLSAARMGMGMFRWAFEIFYPEAWLGVSPMGIDSLMIMVALFLGGEVSGQFLDARLPAPMAAFKNLPKRTLPLLLDAGHFEFSKEKKCSKSAVFFGMNLTGSTTFE